MTNNISNIIIHHSGGTDAYPLQDSSNYTLAMCNADHKVRFNMKSSLGYYVGYHYFIDKAGKITQCRKDTEESAACVGYNNSAYDKYNHPENLAINICLAGNFDATLPTQAQIQTLTGFLQAKVKEYNVDVKKIVPHRKYAKKTCFGTKLSDDFGQKLLKSSPVPTPPVQETFTDKFYRLMLEAGFVVVNGKWVYTR